MASGHCILFALLSLLTVLVHCLPITSPNDQYSVSRLLARGTKAPTLKVCGKIGIPVFTYPGASSVKKAERYQPTYWTFDGDFNFGTTKNPSSQLLPPRLAGYFASEHVLEFQLLLSKHGFFGKIQKLPDPTSTSNPRHAYEKKKLINPKTGKPDGFCEVMAVTWGTSSVMTVDGITGTPMDIISNALPNKKHHTSFTHF
ncbi:hypothetical protein MAPG_06030 [Magnaporthiopsis poae ATCC 64411]|uniref:Uncharacterized protein n=1 Tax=Magnaporthiopsis poae (strain ATCC 64411 / 73-15) TaxID=644358 RepID=A0A0C4E0Y8_MAGP6|nr:hypothetical protein MAPG_06030 [Magnaporthiopsis poae ATCC 64411]